MDRGCGETSGAPTRRHPTSLLQGLVQNPKLPNCVAQHWQYLLGRVTGSKKQYNTIQTSLYNINKSSFTVWSERKCKCHRIDWREVSHTAQSLQMNSAASEKLLFQQRMSQASERTPGHLKCTRIWMVGLFAKLLLHSEPEEVKCVSFTHFSCCAVAECTPGWNVKTSPNHRPGLFSHSFYQLPHCKNPSEKYCH